MVLIIPDVPEYFTGPKVVQRIIEFKLSETIDQQKKYLEEITRYSAETVEYIEKLKLQVKCLEVIHRLLFPCKVEVTGISAHIVNGVAQTLIKAGYTVFVKTEIGSEPDGYNMDGDFRSCTYKYREVERTYINIDNPMLKKY